MIVNLSKITTKDRPVLVLKNAAGTPLGVLGMAYNTRFALKCNETSELEFDLPSRADGLDNPFYQYTTGMKTIELPEIGQFIIINPEETDDGAVKTKHCKCYSLEYEFSMKNVYIESGTYAFWNAANPKDTILGMIMEVMPGWKVGTVATSVKDKYRTFDSVTDNAYNLIKNRIQESYNCLIDFDTLTRTVYVRDCDAEVEIDPVYLSPENLLTEIQVKEDTDRTVTRLDVNGADGVNIRAVNPLGTNYILNLDHYMTPDNFSEQMIRKYGRWKKTLEDAQEDYYLKSCEYIMAVSQLTAMSAEMTDLQGKITNEENVQAVTIQAIAQKLQTQADLDRVNIELKKLEKEAERLQDGIDNADARRQALLSEMKAVNAQCALTAFFSDAELLLLDRYIKDDSITDSTFAAVSVDTYADPGVGSAIAGTGISISDSSVTMSVRKGGSIFYSCRGGNITVGSGIGARLVSAVIEMKPDAGMVISAYTNRGNRSGEAFDGSCISVTGSGRVTKTNVENDGNGVLVGTGMTVEISDGYLYFTEDVTEYQRQSVAWELYDYGVKTLEKVSKPSYEFSVTAANFFRNEDFKAFADKLRIGYRTYVNIGGTVMTPVCTGVSMEYDVEDGLELEFSDTYVSGQTSFKLADLLQKSVSMGSRLDASKYTYSAFENSGASIGIKNYMTSALDVAKNAIMSSTDQAVSWDGAGIRLRKWTDSSQQSYDAEQIWMNNNSILMTEDGWESAVMAIGKFKDDNAGDCWGIVAQMIFGTLIAGSSLIIESEKKSEDGDSETAVFRMDADGCRLYNTDFSISDGARQILLNPDVGVLMGAYPVLDDEGVVEDNANFWVDSGGNVHVKGQINATSLMICDQHGENPQDINTYLGTYISESSVAMNVIKSIAMNVVTGGNMIRNSRSIRVDDPASLTDVVLNIYAQYSSLTVSDPTDTTTDTVYLSRGAFTVDPVSSDENVIVANQSFTMDGVANTTAETKLSGYNGSISNPETLVYSSGSRSVGPDSISTGLRIYFSTTIPSGYPYRVTVNDLTLHQGTATRAEWGLLDPNANNAIISGYGGYLNFASGAQTFTFTAPRDCRLVIFAGENGSTQNNQVSISGLTVNRTAGDGVYASIYTGTFGYGGGDYNIEISADTVAQSTDATAETDGAGIWLVNTSTGTTIDNVLLPVGTNQTVRVQVSGSVTNVAVRLSPGIYGNCSGKGVRVVNLSIKQYQNTNNDNVYTEITDDLVIGGTYSLSVEGVTLTQGTATRLNVGVLVGATEHVLAQTIEVTDARQSFTFTANGSPSWGTAGDQCTLVIYAGLSGSTSGNVATANNVIVRGNDSKEEKFMPIEWESGTYTMVGGEPTAAANVACIRSKNGSDVLCRAGDEVSLSSYSAYTAVLYTSFDEGTTWTSNALNSGKYVFGKTGIARIVITKTGGTMSDADKEEAAALFTVEGEPDYYITLTQLTPGQTYTVSTTGIANVSGGADGERIAVLYNGSLRSVNDMTDFTLTTGTSQSWTIEIPETDENEDPFDSVLLVAYAGRYGRHSVMQFSNLTVMEKASEKGGTYYTAISSIPFTGQTPLSGNYKLSMDSVSIYRGEPAKVQAALIYYGAGGIVHEVTHDFAITNAQQTWAFDIESAGIKPPDGVTYTRCDMVVYSGAKGATKGKGVTLRGLYFRKVESLNQGGDYSIELCGGLSANSKYTVSIEGLTVNHGNPDAIEFAIEYTVLDGNNEPMTVIDTEHSQKMSKTGGEWPVWPSYLVFETDNDPDRLNRKMRVYAGEHNETSGVSITLEKVMLARGDEYNGWVPHVDDPTETVVNTSLVLDENGIVMTGGSIDITAGSEFRVNSGGKVTIEADDDDSYIRFGGTADNPNFIVGKGGDVIGQNATFKSLVVGGVDLKSYMLQNISAQIQNAINQINAKMPNIGYIVSTDMPTGVVDKLWIQPYAESGDPTPSVTPGTDTGVTTQSTQYLVTSVNNSAIGGYYGGTGTYNATRSGNQITGSTCSYGMYLRIYNYNGSTTLQSLTVTLSDGMSAPITLFSNNYGGVGVQNGGYITVNTMDTPLTNQVNLTGSSSLTLTIDLNKGMQSACRFVYDEFRLVVTSQSGGTQQVTPVQNTTPSSSGMFRCNVYYIPGGNG